MDKPALWSSGTNHLAESSQKSKLCQGAQTSPKPFAWAWVWVMGVRWQFLHGENKMCVTVTLLQPPFFLAAGVGEKSKNGVSLQFCFTIALLITFEWASLLPPTPHLLFGGCSGPFCKTKKAVKNISRTPHLWPQNVLLGHSIGT